MEPEQEDGNIEYKLKLLDISKERVDRLASQMRYRCNEGNSECIYNIGVEDDGTMSGLTEEEYELTMKCLHDAASLNDCSVSLLTTTPVSNNKLVYEVLVRERNEASYIDVKTAIAGSVDCGKSTLLSVLTTGNPDNGRGSGRISVFNFPHEVETGRTSSVGHQIVGYNNDGQVMNYRDGRLLAWPDIVRSSTKVISFFDLAGHEKYLKTTISGLASSRPDVCLIMIGANRGVLKMTIEHIFLCKTLHIPFALVVTKIDMVKDKENILEDTLGSIQTMLKKPGMRRIPIRIKTKGDIIRCAINMMSESIVPIFLVSNVTLEGIDELHAFMNLVPKKPSRNADENVECHLDIAWNVTGVGTVVGGHLVSGSVQVGDKLWFGPNQSKYTQVTVKSLHCKKVQIQRISTQSYICLALRGINKADFKRGNVLVSSKAQHIVCERIIADVEVLKTHSTTIKPGYQPMMHAQHVRTCVTIEDVSEKVSGRAQKHGKEEDKVLRTGDTARVTLKLCFGKKFIKVGTDILLCEGRTKVIGHIKQTD